MRLTFLGGSGGMPPPQENEIHVYMYVDYMSHLSFVYMYVDSEGFFDIYM